MVRVAFTKFWKFWKLQATDKYSRILVCFAQRNWPFQRRSQLFSSAIQFQALADIVKIISKIFPIKPTNFWVRKAAVVPPGYFFVAKHWSLTLWGAARFAQGLTVQPCAVAKGRQKPLRAEPGSLAIWPGAEIARPWVQRSWQPCLGLPRLLWNDPARRTCSIQNIGRGPASFCWPVHNSKLVQPPQSVFAAQSWGWQHNFQSNKYAIHCKV